MPMSEGVRLWLMLYFAYGRYFGLRYLDVYVCAGRMLGNSPAVGET